MNADTLFSCCMPTGWVWCDTSKEEHGDYKRIAYMSYSKLVLEVDDPKSPLLPLVREDAERLQAKRGELYPIAGNMEVRLGQ